MLKVRALEICRAKHQQSCDFKNLNFVLRCLEQETGRLYSQLTLSLYHSQMESVLFIHKQKRGLKCTCTLKT